MLWGTGNLAPSTLARLNYPPGDTPNPHYFALVRDYEQLRVLRHTICPKIEMIHDRRV